MQATFEKLNLGKNDRIVVLNAPASFEPELASLNAVTVTRKLSGLDDIPFALAFVTKQQEVDTLAKAIASKAKGDAIVWFAYPKGTSKKYKSEIDRDHGWQALGTAGFEPVRSVAIDEDWSACRFRRIEFIKNMIRKPEHLLTRGGSTRMGKK